jgi:serine/threonine protein kinase
MSPEQASGVAVDQRTDLFSLGSVMYAMATGHPPFRAETAMGVLHRICHDRPRPLRELQPDLPPWFDSLVQRLLEKRPDHRLESAEKTADLLAQSLAYLQQPTQVELPEPLRLAETRGTRQSTNRRAYRRFLPIALSAITTCALLLLALTAMWLQPDAAETIEQLQHAPATFSDELLEWDDNLDQELEAIEQELWNLENW